MCEVYECVCCVLHVKTIPIRWPLHGISKTVNEEKEDENFVVAVVTVIDATIERKLFRSDFGLSYIVIEVWIE